MFRGVQRRVNRGLSDRMVWLSITCRAARCGGRTFEVEEEVKENGKDYEITVAVEDGVEDETWTSTRSSGLDLSVAIIRCGHRRDRFYTI